MGRQVSREVVRSHTVDAKELRKRLVRQASADRKAILCLLRQIEAPPLRLGAALEDVANVYLDCADEITRWNRAP